MKMASSHHQLQRTMSLTDLNTSSAIRDTIERDLTVPADRSKHRFFLQSPRHDFVLPSLTRFDLDFRKFLLSALVDFHLMRELEDARCLNWCPVLPKFLPLQTLGDGNCLMHAASLCMWAVQDRRLLLRKSVYQVMVEDKTDMFRKRWQLEQEKCLEQQNGSPVDCSSEQWNEDWKKTVDLASTMHSSETHTLNALEEIHIFTLANIIRRPIFVLCEDVHRGNYDESVADVNLGGIYLPLLCDSVDCVKSPLVIGYHQGHFSALVTTEDGSRTGEDMFRQKQNKSTVPLVKYDGSAMQTHFLLPEEQQCSDRLLREYLNCSKVEYTNNGVTSTVLVATMHSQEPEVHLDRMFKTYFSALQDVYLGRLMERQLSFSGQHHVAHPMSSGKPSYGIQYHRSPALQNRSNFKSSTCCSAHKRCKNAVCENYTTHTQEYCHQCRKPNPQLCTSPGCTFAANPDYEGLCSVCFARLHAILEQGTNMVMPSAPPSNMCINSNCQKEAGTHFHGKCHDCYMQEYIHGPTLEFRSSKPTEGEQSTSTKPMIQQAGKNYGLVGKPPLPRQSSTLFCFNQTCNNFLRNTEQIYCEACLPPESRTNVHSATSNNIDQPAALNTVYSVCHIPNCGLPAATYHGELCLKHYHQSQNAHVNDHHMVQAGPGMKCIITGCRFFGLEEHNYLCSQCHAKALQDECDMEKIQAEQNRESAEWIAQLANCRSEKHQFELGGAIVSRKPFYYEQISTPSRSFSAPPSPNPRRKLAIDMVPCVTKGCPQLGTKDKQGLCDVCFKKQQNLLYRGASKRTRVSSSP